MGGDQAPLWAPLVFTMGPGEREALVGIPQAGQAVEATHTVDSILVFHTPPTPQQSTPPSSGE